jgi:hypothetical protein
MGSYTGTITYARFSLLTIQVMDVFRLAASPSKDDHDKISRGLNDKDLEEIIIKGLFSDGTKAAEIRIKIDWRMHKISATTGGDKVQVPKYWTDGKDPGIIEMANLFNPVCTENKLPKEWTVLYCAHLDEQKMDEKYDFVDAKKRDFASGGVDEITRTSGPTLDELSQTLSFAKKLTRGEADKKNDIFDW